MDLTTTYLGLDLRNPLVASASPLSSTVAGIRQLADSGVGAIVLYSLLEEQLRCGEAGEGVRRYVSLIEQASCIADVPVIASLNGTSPGAWTDFAATLEKAGAAAIEVNVYHPLDSPSLSGRDVEQRYLELLTTVKAVVGVPVAIKLDPYFSSVAEIARRLDSAGADGLVLFNRFLQPDIDAETLKVIPGIELSTPSEARLPRTWIALLAGRVEASLAASTGVDGAGDVVKYLLAGADVVMTASALVRYGPGHARVLLDGLTDWMSHRGFTNLAAVRGLLSAALAEGEPARERGGYVTSLLEADLG